MSLRDDISKKTGVEPKLKIGRPGSLDVFADGKLIWSKEKQGRMPTADEIVAQLPAHG